MNRTVVTDIHFILSQSAMVNPPLAPTAAQRSALERAMVKKTTQLIKKRYSPQELAECSLSGLGGRRVLDAKILDDIRQEVFQEFSGHLAVLGVDNNVWQKCRNAISSMCKNMRSAMLMKQMTFYKSPKTANS